jgi:hypothetical protein
MSKGTNWTAQDLEAKGYVIHKGNVAVSGKVLDNTKPPHWPDMPVHNKPTIESPPARVGIFEAALIHEGLPLPHVEYRFHHTKKWRFDYAWPYYKVAVEQEGGVFGHKKKDGTKSDKGAHSSVSGILRDMHKYNEATLLGWRVIRVLPSDLTKIKTMKMIKQLLYPTK